MVEHEPVRTGAAPRPPGRPHWGRLALIAAYCLVALLLAARPLLSGADDLNYLAYFSGDSESIGSSWLALLLEEPLWLAYASTLGAVLGPEAALRLTIFVAVVGFLVASTRISRGAWALVLATFLLDQSMATLFYNIQLRNGLALTVLLVLIALRVNAGVATLIAAAIHTSFLVAVPCAIAVRFTTRRTLGLVAGVLAILATAAALGRLVPDLNLGRRTGTYEAAGTSNVMFYAVALVQYGLVAWGCWSYRGDERLRRLFHFVTLFLVCGLALTFVHEAAVRLVFIARVLLVLCLGACTSRVPARLAAIAWVALLVLLVGMEYGRNPADPDSWFARWQAILGA